MSLEKTVCLFCCEIWRNCYRFIKLYELQQKMQDSKTEMALKTRQKFIKKSKQPHKDFDPIVIRFLKDRFSVGEKTRTYSKWCTSIITYMCFSFWLLGVESRDFSHAEKERTACKAEQIHSKWS